MKVIVPLRNKYIFNLFCHSKIKNKTRILGQGTLLETEGKCILMYFYGDRRNGYLVRPLLPNEPEEHVPNVEEPCRILFEIEGRLIDEWKFLLYRLEKEYGKSVYEKNDEFWLKTGLLVQERTKIRQKLSSRNNKKKKEVRHERTIKRRKKRRIKRISRSR